MSVVSLLGVKILNNPAPFDAKYQFEITFECLEPLQKGKIGQFAWMDLQTLTLGPRSRVEVDLRWIRNFVRLH